MGTVRFGVIGLGTIGSHHTDYLSQGRVSGAVVTAVCETVNKERFVWAREKCGPGLLTFDDPETMFASGKIDAVIVATPHYFHPPLAIQAFRHHLHVLIEKPAGVYTRQVREMNAVAARSKRKFGIMFSLRTVPIHGRLHAMATSGELGRIQRSEFTSTNWFRSQSYYDSGTWRATWEGEGGGVLLNQCPHQLDLWQWIVGMPKRVRAFCQFGKHHKIEVEDEVTAYVEYPNGATGVFIASTSEAPGTSRLEIAADNGKTVLEGGELTVWRTEQPVSKFLRGYKGGFGEPETERTVIPADPPDPDGNNCNLTRDFVRSILEDTPLLAPGSEGMNSLQLSNAMLMSTWIDDWVELPVNEKRFYTMLQDRIAKSKLKKKKAAKVLTAGLSRSFKR